MAYILDTVDVNEEVVLIQVVILCSSLETS